MDWSEKDKLRQERQTENCQENGVGKNPDLLDNRDLGKNETKDENHDQCNNDTDLFLHIRKADLRGTSIPHCQDLDTCGRKSPHSALPRARLRKDLCTVSCTMWACSASRSRKSSDSAPLEATLRRPSVFSRGAGPAPTRLPRHTLLARRLPPPPCLALRRLRLRIQSRLQLWVVAEGVLVVIL